MSDHHHAAHFEPSGKIKLVPSPEVKDKFVCKRCGCTLKREVSVTTHKFGGYGIGSTLVMVCPNCLYGGEYQF